MIICCFFNCFLPPESHHSLLSGAGCPDFPPWVPERILRGAAIVREVLAGRRCRKGWTQQSWWWWWWWWWWLWLWWLLLLYYYYYIIIIMTGTLMTVFQCQIRSQDFRSSIRDFRSDLDEQRESLKVLQAQWWFWPQGIDIFGMGTLRHPAPNWEASTFFFVNIYIYMYLLNSVYVLFHCLTLSSMLTLIT